MNLLIRHGLACLVALFLAWEPVALSDGPSSPIVVELPPGDIEITYVESAWGMNLAVRCGNVDIHAQKFYLGDGKTAVPYEATPFGFFTPTGKTPSARAILKQGETVHYDRAKQAPWGKQRGELYLLTESMNFQPKP